MNTRVPRIARPATNEGVRYQRLRNPRARSTGTAGSCSTAAAVAASVISVEPHPWIEHGVDDVRDQVDQHHQDREHQRDALDDGEVALQDRVDHQAADPGQGEHLLDHQRAADEVGDVQAEHGDHGDDAVAHRVADDDAPLGDPLGAGGGDVVGLQYVQ